MKSSTINLTGLFLLISIGMSFSQVKMRKLPANVNQPSVNLFAPAISGDGATLVYLSDYTDDGEHSMNFTTRKTVSSWNEPVEISKVVNRPTLNYRGGYCLSFDGDMLFYTSRKTGLGGFDLWYSSKQGSNWGAPVNMGKPINSPSNEGTPSISQDGQYLYFMRCDRMTEKQGASGCTLYVSKKKYNRWQEPEPLPANINTGNSQNPKILADNETLIFSSDQFGGAGGLDLLMSRKTGDTWSDPIPMDFLNTEKNDQFVSIPSKGRYVFIAQYTGRENQVVQLLIPEEFKPKGVMRIQAEVVDKVSGMPVDARLTVFNVSLRDRIWNDEIGDKGEFTLALNEGDIYDLSVAHPDPSYKYFSKIYDLEEMGRRDKEKLMIELSPLEAGNEYETDIFFEPFTASIDDGATYELRRLNNMIKRNPAIQLEIIVSQNSYREDSIQSSMDLTEVTIDSIYQEKNVLVTEIDSLSDQTEPYDTADLDNKVAVESDSTLSEESKYTTIEELILSTTYHNDRTAAQAQAVKQYLVSKGALEENLSIKTSKKTSTEITEDESKKSISELVKIRIIKL